MRKEPMNKTSLKVIIEDLQSGDMLRMTKAGKNFEEYRSNTSASVFQSAFDMALKIKSVCCVEQLKLKEDYEGLIKAIIYLEQK